MTTYGLPHIKGQLIQLKLSDQIVDISSCLNCLYFMSVKDNNGALHVTPPESPSHELNSPEFSNQRIMKFMVGDGI